MALMLRYDHHKGLRQDLPAQAIASEARLNRLALEYGYKYRLDIRPKNGLARIEFVQTLLEARFIGRPIRKLGGVVEFHKICEDGTLKRHGW